MFKKFVCALHLFLFTAPLLGHHGVASLGIAGIEGPGAPVETSNSVTLPEKSLLAYLKLDYAAFKKKTAVRDDEADFNAFWMFGLGYGIKSWLSAYLFVPYYSKVLEDNSFNTTGFADISLMGVFGFKYDEGFMRVPRSESLDDLEDWHFTVFGGLSLPTGNANISDAAGSIDPGQSLGFGKPAYQLGATATKMFTERDTVVFDTSYLWFMENEYDDQSRMKFGSEYRVNLALAHRFYTNASAKFRFDGIFETNYLNLGRDRADGTDEIATGGHILYLQPGMRVYVKNTSVALGVKIPTWTGLNEEDLQQGAEGTERYRIEFTFSALF
jgi:hypothetical protein